MTWLYVVLDILRAWRQRDRDEWRHVAEPPNWKCRRHGQDYL